MIEKAEKRVLSVSEVLKSVGNPKTVSEALEKFRAQDQRVAFDLQIHRIYAPQDGPMGIHELDPAFTTGSATDTMYEDGPEKSDMKTTRQRGKTQIKTIKVPLHLFQREDDDVILPVGGPRGLLMTALYQATREIYGMGYLTPSLRFMRIEPETVRIKAPANIPIDVIREPRGKVTKNGRRESQAPIAYQYLSMNGEAPSHRLEAVNSSIAKLSKAEWGILLHALETINAPPIGRGLFGITPVMA